MLHPGVCVCVWVFEQLSALQIDAALRVCVQFEGVVLCVSFFVRETSHKVQPIPMNIPRARVRACAAKMCRMCVCVCVE